MSVRAGRIFLTLLVRCGFQPPARLSIALPETGHKEHEKGGDPSRLIAAIGSLRTTPIPPRRSHPIILENVPVENQE